MRPNLTNPAMFATLLVASLLKGNVSHQLSAPALLAATSLVKQSRQDTPQ
jgi:hypothetical protein